LTVKQFLNPLPEHRRSPSNRRWRNHFQSPEAGIERAGQGRKGSPLISDSRFNASTLKNNSPETRSDGMRRLFVPPKDNLVKKMSRISDTNNY